MNRTRIFFAISALCVLFIAGCTGSGKAAWDFEGSTGYRSVDGNGYYFNKAGTYAFLNDFAWDLSDEFVLELPEKADGAVVFGVGGFFGTGVPVQAVPNTDSTAADNNYWFEKAREEFGEDLEVRHPVIRVILGKNITGTVRLLGGFFLLSDETEDGRRIGLIPRYYFECSEENSKYYSKDGHLYYKTGQNQNEDVKPGPYWDDPDTEY